jgi:predicted RNase H-like nuclease (RuvC/YqgF family)
MYNKEIEKKNEIIRNLEWEVESKSEQIKEQHDRINNLNTYIKNFELENENLKYELNEYKRFKESMKQFLGIMYEECKEDESNDGGIRMKLTGEQRKQIAIDVLKEFVSIEWESDANFAYVEDIKGARFILEHDTENTPKLKPIEIGEEI